MSNTVYEASVYSRIVTYKNFKGEERSVELFFALDPLELLQVIAGFKPKTSKSNNPAKREEAVFDDADQVKFVRDICIKAAGEPSDDGEVWHPFPEFSDSIAGKAFLTKLASSDGDRKEFAQKVILDPFRAYVNFARADESNSAKDIQNFERMLGQLENVFVDKPVAEESYEDRRARLQKELAEINEPNGGTPAGE